MELNRISSMTVDELKNVLHLCSLKTAGLKQELVARVFEAIESNVPLVKTADKVEKELALGYKAKLVIEDELIPNPFKTTDGWLGEKNGLPYWPTTVYPGIYFVLVFHPNKLEATNLGDYKMTKAYSYCSDGCLHP